jgi:hypothetical protein
LGLGKTADEESAGPHHCANRALKNDDIAEPIVNANHSIM